MEVAAKSFITTSLCQSRNILCFFFSSRGRHTRYVGDWVQTCALPISGGDACRGLRAGRRSPGARRVVAGCRLLMKLIASSRWSDDGVSPSRGESVNARRKRIEVLSKIGRASCREKGYVKIGMRWLL